MERSKRDRRHTINACESISTARSELDEDGLSTRGRVEPVRLLVGYDSEVAQWVANELGIRDFGLCSAIGIIQGGRIIAGVVYSSYKHPNIEASIASISPHWCTRNIMHHLFNYPFNQLKCRRITFHIKSENTAIRAKAERAGFVHEGTLRHALETGDQEIYGMLKHECRWIR